ncbi:hypothetical protein NDU88_003807 [Pleurodeles waltl]|uniref:Uncharacterized protein n=1 Tax=Pleurodeles waltl TaxID=8319 RepID=A0AAV7MSP7_PLEWA|nr:hypothetical protein NDU88_003807 [Pleurodeles waltl]
MIRKVIVFPGRGRRHLRGGLRLRRAHGGRRGSFLRHFLLEANQGHSLRLSECFGLFSTGSSGERGGLLRAALLLHPGIRGAAPGSARPALPRGLRLWWQLAAAGLQGAAAPPAQPQLLRLLSGPRAGQPTHLAGRPDTEPAQPAAAPWRQPASPGPPAHRCFLLPALALASLRVSGL